MVCVLTQEQKEILFKVISRDLLDKAQAKEKFDLQSYVKSIYDLIKEGNSQDVALAYAALVPRYIKLISGLDPNVDNLIEPAIAKIFEADRLFKDIDAVESFLGLTPPVKSKEEEKKTQEVEVQSKVDIKASEPAANSITRVFSALPNTLYTTTGNSQDPSLAFNYAFIKHLVDTDQFDTDKSGLYLTFTHSGSALKESQMPNPGWKEGFIQIVTDEEGNILYFNDNFEKVSEEEGRPVFFRQRGIKAEFVEALSKVQTIQEIEKDLGEDAATVLSRLQFQYRDILEKAEIVKQNPNARIVQRIAGVSRGFLEEAPVSASLDLANAEDLSDGFLLVTVKKYPGQPKPKQIYSFVRGSGRAPIPFIMKETATNLEFIDKAARVIAGVDVVDDSGNPDSELLLPLRRKFLSVFFGNNATIVFNKELLYLRYKSADGKSYEVEELSSDPEVRVARIKEALIQSRDGWKHTFNVYDFTKNNINYVPFFKEENGKLVLSSNGLDYTGYKKFVQQNAKTQIKYDSSGVFNEQNGYFIYENIQGVTYEKATEESKEAVKETPKTKKTKTNKKAAKETTKAPIKAILGLGEIKTPDFVAPSEILKKDKGTLNKLKEQGIVGEEVTQEQIDEAEQWYNQSPISKFVPYNKMFSIINTENPSSIATFSKAGITLYKGSTSADLYHEAWHAFTQMFLSPSELDAIYSEARKKQGTFKDFNGNTVSFKDASILQLEEYLAEDFRGFMLNKKFISKKEEPVKKTIFDKILDILKILFNVNDLAPIKDRESAAFFETVYNKLRLGNIVPVPYSVLNSDSIQTLNKIVPVDPLFMEAGEALTYGDAQLVVDSIDSYFSEYIDELNAGSSKKYTASILTNPEDRANAYNGALIKFIEQYKKLHAELSAIEDPDSLEYVNKYKYFRIAEYVVANFSPNSTRGETITSEDIFSSENDMKGVIAYHMQNSKYLKFEDKFGLEDPEEQKTSRESYAQKAGNEVSMKELATDEVLYVIRSLFEYDKKGNPIKNPLGFNKLIEFDLGWNKIQKALEGKFDIIEQYNTLVEKAKKDKTIAQLISKLGSPDPFTEGVPTNSDADILQVNLWTNFRNAFGATRIKLVQLTIDLQSDGSNLTGVKLTTGNAVSDVSKISQDWDNDFNKPNNENPYIIKREKGSSDKFTGNKLDIPAVIRDFKTKHLTSPYQFLKALGMNISNEEEILNAINPGGKLSILAEALMSKLLKINANNLDPESYNITIGSVTELVDLPIDGQNETGNFKALLELENKYSEKYRSGMVPNAKGDPQYEFSLRSTVSQQIDNLNSANDYISLIADPTMAHLDFRRNPFAKNLLILEELFGEDFQNPAKGKKKTSKSRTGATKKARIDLLNSSGVSTTINGEFANLGVASAEADEVTQMLHNFYSFLTYGVSEATRHADKATTYLYKMRFTSKKMHYFPIEQFATYSTLRGDLIEAARGTRGMRDAAQRMLKYLDSEISRIHRLRSGDPAGDALVGDNTYKEVGNKFVIFEDILTPGTKEKLLSNFISDNFYDNVTDPTKPESDLYTTILNEILDYFELQIDAFQEDLSKIPLMESKLMDNIRPIITNSNEVSDSLQTTELNPIQQKYVDHALVAGYVVNDWIQKYELTSLFYGDVALYNMLKEEFHKRNAGVASTGTIPRNDDAMLALLNTSLKGNYADSVYFKNSGLTAVDKVYNKYLRTAILEDTKSSSVYLSSYIEAAIAYERKRNGALSDDQIKDIFSEYSKMKEGDAQGFITFDSYRALLLRLGKWSPYQEELYQAINRGENIDMEKLSKFFPVKKMQYWGPLKTDEGLPLMAFHKFSLMPLIPNVIKGTNLELLHNKMVSQGFDYATFQSGSKINSIGKNGKIDQFYSDKTGKNRTLAMEDPAFEFTPNDIFIDYFKDQLETPEKFKHKVIFSTQLRKLIEEGLMEEGIPTDFDSSNSNIEERVNNWMKLSEADKIKASKNYQLLINYENNITELTEFKTRELIREGGITQNSDGTFTLSESFIDFIKKELTKQDLAEHEIDFIKYDSKTNSLVYDLSYHPSADKIERTLTAIVYRRLVKQKVSGEALIQVSGVGSESRGKFRAATDEEMLKYGTNDLPFYNNYGWNDFLRDGLDPNSDIPSSMKTKAMKVKIALQGDYRKLLYHPDVIKYAKDNKVSKLKALNTLIKDEEWLDKGDNRKMVSMVGVRIPVQGLNSMEFAEVYEFLPENAGNVIILPAEIVAKAGSDFDIDKLTMIFPSLYKTSKGIELVVHDQNNEESVNENKELLISLQKKLDSLYDSLDESLMVDTDAGKMKATKAIRLRIKMLKEARLELKERIAIAKSTGNEDLDQLFEYLKNYKDEINELYDQNASISDSVKEFMQKEIDPVIDQIDDLRTKIASGSGKGLENKTLFSILDILTHPQNYVDLITPNGTFLVQPIAEKYSKEVRDYNSYETLTTESGEPVTFKGKKIIAGTRIFELRYNRYKQSSNNIGKQTLGLGAVDNTYNTMFTRVGAYLNKVAILGGKKKYVVPQVIRMPHNQTNGNISLARIYDVNNKNRISTLISQLMNGWVDVAKDAWIFDIQGNKEVAPVLLFLIQAGVDIEQAVAFVSQPSVREYVKMQRYVKSTFAEALGMAANNREVRIKAKEIVLKKLLEGKPEYGQQFDIMHQTKTVYQVLIPKYLTNPDFSTTTLEANAFNKDKKDGFNSEEKVLDDYDLQTFLHFIELEEMSKATTEIKLGVNVDTAKSTNIFSAKERLLKIESLNKASRLDNAIVDKILGQSPIASFKVQDFMIDFLEKLFPLRNNENFTAYLSDFLKSIDFEEDYSEFFNNIETLALTFQNDFSNYALQRYLKDVSTFDYTDTYNTLDLDFNVEPVKRLTYQAFVKENDKGEPTIYVDLTQVKKDLVSKQVFNSRYFMDKGRAPVEQTYFTGTKSEILSKYLKFLYERETLRYRIPFSEYKKTADFNYRLKIYRKTQAKEKGQSLELYNQMAEHYVYEHFLRDTALSNTLNINFMFKDMNGIAKQVIQLNSIYPELMESYQILRSLIYVNNKTTKNLRFSERKLEENDINIYNDDLIRLADPDVKKVDNPVDNQIISNLFRVFPYFAFIQSGQDMRGPYSLARVINATNLKDTLKEAKEHIMPDLNDSDTAESLLNNYKTMFNSMYKSLSEEALDMMEEPTGKKKSRIKKYTPSEKAIFKESSSLLNEASYDNSILTYNTGIPVVTSGNAKKQEVKLQGIVDPKTFKTEVTKAVKQNNNLVFVYDDLTKDVLPSLRTTVGIKKEKYNNTYIKALVYQKAIPKENTLGIKTKPEAFINRKEYLPTFNSKEEVDAAIRTIDDAIDQMVALKNSGKQLVFNNNGYGQALAGFGFNEMRLTANRLSIGKEDKVFVHLSKRLFDEFGFINPGFLSYKESEYLFKNQPISDAEVREKIKQCFYE